MLYQQKMSLISLPRELLYFVAHSLSIAQVHTLAYSNKQFHRLLINEEYWHARALFEGVCSPLTQLTSYYNLYHGYLTRVDSSWTEEVLVKNVPFVSHYNSVAWTTNEEIFLVDYYGVPQCNLTARGIRIRRDENGAYAIIHSKGPYPDCGGEGSWIMYINEENELWYFAHYWFASGEHTMHTLLARDVRTAGYENDHSYISLFIVTLDGQLLFYRENWIHSRPSHKSIYCCNEEECNKTPINRERFQEVSYPGESPIVQIVYIDNNSLYYFRDKASHCYRYERKRGNWTRIRDADMIYYDWNRMLSYHHESGWSEHWLNWLDSPVREHKFDLDVKLVLLHGLHFFLYEGYLFSPPDLIDLQYHEHDALAVRLIK